MTDYSKSIPVLDGGQWPGAHELLPDEERGDCYVLIPRDNRDGALPIAVGDVIPVFAAAATKRVHPAIRALLSGQVTTQAYLMTITRISDGKVEKMYTPDADSGRDTYVGSEVVVRCYGDLERIMDVQAYRREIAAARP